MIVFGGGAEPWSVARHKVKRWLHCLVRDVNALPADCRDELNGWLAERGMAGPSVLVTRDAVGAHQLQVSGSALDVDLAELPAWLQQPVADPQPKPVRVRKATRA